MESGGGADREVALPRVVDAESIADLERQLFEPGDVCLVWSSPAEFRGPFDRVRLLHAIITWGRRSGSGALKVDRELSTDATLDRCLCNDELLVAALLARRIYGPDGGSIALRGRAAVRRQMDERRAISRPGAHRTLVVSAAEPEFAYSPDVMVLKQRGPTTDYSARTLFFRVDLEPLSTSERGNLIGAGENISKDVYGREWLTRAVWPPEHPLEGTDVEPLASRLLAPSKGMRDHWVASGHPEGSSPADWLGSALWEVFQNTEHHALASRGETLSREVRMIIASSASPDDLVRGGGASATYASRIRAGALRPDSFLAVSTLDSGDGLAYTVASRRGKVGDDGLGLLPEYEEIEFLKDAVRGKSRSPQRPLHGFGMVEVAHLLTDMHGFLEVRSGSLTVFRDFDLNPYSPGRDSATDWGFEDVAPEDRKRRFGSAVTMVIPRIGGAR